MSYTEVIKSTHWFIRKDELKKPLYELRDELTVHSKFDERDPVPVYEETDTHFGVPLYYRDVGRYAERVVDQTVEGADIDIEFKSTLRPRQVPVHEYLVHSLAQGKTGFVIKAATGTGKTVLLIDFFAMIKKTVLVIVPRETIIQQWIDRLIEHSSLTRDDIGIAQQDKCEFQGKKVVIGMVHSLVKDRYPEEFKNYFGVIAYDEVHTAGAETFSIACSLYPAKYRIGVSASVDKRADGMDDLYKMHMQQVRIDMAGGTMVKPTVLLRPYEGLSTHKYLESVRDKKKRRGIIITEISKDVARNALIAVYVRKFHNSGRRTLLLSDRKEQLEKIKKMLVARHGLTPPEIGLFHGTTRAAERRRILEKCPVILATYGVFAMAVDVPDLRALIFATPLSDVEQSMGRVSRLCETAKDPFVLDIIDETYQDTIGWAYNRQRHYREAGVKLVEVSAT